MDNIEHKKSDIIFYTTSDGDLKIEVFYQDETVWLTQKRLAELFDVGVNTINYYLKEIFKSVIRKYRITADDGKKYNTNFYNRKITGFS